MMYAIRNDLQGWRAIADRGDVGPDEHFSDEHPGPVAARPLSRDQIEAQRLTAYADPVTGSDRYFSEVVRLNSMGGTPAEIAVARTAGESRYAEIQAEYPWP